MKFFNLKSAKATTGTILSSRNTTNLEYRHNNVRCSQKVPPEKVNTILQTSEPSTVLSPKIGVPASTIRSIRNKHGISIGNHLKIDDPILFQTRYDELQSASKMGEIYGVSKSTILKYARSIGYDVSSHPILSSDAEKYIVDNYNNYSASFLSKKFNVSESKIGQVWSQHGLKGKQKRVYQLDEHCFDDIHTELQAYFLGFCASDGCLYETKYEGKQNIIRICIHEKDQQILETFRTNLFKTDKPISHHKQYVSLEISSDTIYNHIYDLGLHPRKTYGNTIVDFGQRDDLMIHFIRGYFDGDGSISRTIQKRRLQDVNISISGFYPNMKKLMNFLYQKNIYATFYTDQRSCYAGRQFGYLQVCNKCNKYAFLKLIYENASIYLQRKYELAIQFIDIIESDDRPSHLNAITYYQYAVKPSSHINTKGVQKCD